MRPHLNGIGNLPEAAGETLGRLEEGRRQARHGLNLLATECHQLDDLIRHEFHCGAAIRVEVERQSE